MSNWSAVYTDSGEVSIYNFGVHKNKLEATQALLLRYERKRIALKEEYDKAVEDEHVIYLAFLKALSKSWTSVSSHATR